MAYYQRYMQLGATCDICKCSDDYLHNQKNPFHHATFFCGIYTLL